MTVVFPHPLFPITIPQTFWGRKWLFSRLLLLLPNSASCAIHLGNFATLNINPPDLNKGKTMKIIKMNYLPGSRLLIFQRKKRYNCGIISSRGP